MNIEDDDLVLERMTAQNQLNARKQAFYKECQNQQKATGKVRVSKKESNHKNKRIVVTAIALIIVISGSFAAGYTTRHNIDEIKQSINELFMPRYSSGSLVNLTDRVAYENKMRDKEGKPHISIEDVTYNDFDPSTGRYIEEPIEEVNKYGGK